jgi:hypothetical protein
LAVALLAAAVSHTPEGEEVLRGARMRLARKPSGVARELLKNFPKGKRKRKRKGKGGQGENGGAPEAAANGGQPSEDGGGRSKRRRRRKPKASKAGEVDLARADGDAVPAGGGDEQVAPVVDTVGDS